ncbi:MAG: hypothetical protein WCT53_01685 [Candidatus Gracilibacteria bacterium]
MQTKATSKIRMEFTRENQDYYADFDVIREESGLTYKMHATVYSAKGKKIFEKERHGLDYSQVEMALVFVFHQAFVEE